MSDILDIGSVCIKNFSLSKSADSTISLSVTVAPDELAIVYGVAYNFYGMALELKSLQKGPTTSSLSFSSLLSDGNRLKAKRSIVFKTIPTTIYNMYSSVMIPKAIMPPLHEPDMDIRIMLCDDPYGIESWRARDIFDALGLHVNLPAILDYRVFELSIKEGTPMLSMLQGMFPFPGVSVSYFNGVYYVNMNSAGFDADIMHMCEMTSSSSQIKYYKTTVTGLNSEPRNVINDVNDGNMDVILEADNSYLRIQTNLIGGIHGTLSEGEYNKSQSTYISEMYDVL